MSASNEKRTEKINRREERSRKEQQEKRKIRVIAIIVVVVFLLLVSVALVLNSKFIRRTLPAITIGGVDFSAAEFKYFYSNAVSEYTNYVNQYSEQFGESYASSMLPSEDIPYSSQIFDNETGETWDDYFTKSTIDQMSELVKYYNASKAAGYVLPGDKRETIETEMSEFRMYAEMYEYPSLDAFLQQAFQNSYLNEKAMRQIREFTHTAVSYNEYINGSFTYSESQLADYYAENKTSLDSYTYRYFQITPESVIQDDYETEEEYTEAQEAAQAATFARTEEIAEGIITEEDFIAEALAYNMVEYGDPNSTLRVYPGSWLTDPYKEWLEDEGREYGDVAAFEMSNGSYVVFFISRDSNEYNMVEMNQMLFLREEVSPDEFEEGEDDPEYLEALVVAAGQTKERAELLFNMFVGGGATKEYLLEIMPENSDDTTADGFYDKITRNSANNKLVPEVEEWLFAPGRKVGDYKLIETQAYGYHLVYFSGFGERYCDFLADEGLRKIDYTAWEESLVPVEAVKRWAYIFV